MELGGSVPYSRDPPAPRQYTELVYSSPHPINLRLILIISFHLLQILFKFCLPFSGFLTKIFIPVGLNSRALWDKYCLRPLENWDRRFESCSGHGCVSAFLYIGRGLGAGLIPHPRSPTKCLKVP